MTNNASLDAVVQNSIAEALGLDTDEVVPDATLLGDLDAESIDLLDILFRIERASGVKVKMADLTEVIQGGISDEDFADEDDVITAVGLAQLKKVLPQIDTDALAGKLVADEVLTLFTVQNLTDMVAERADSTLAAA
ncbi:MULTISPECIES: acyl carrier protein [Streptomyces]|uniref:acyl carrier protein n=1 Tax=Streptomyces TaxID=1883 RepID=UPI000F7B766D|nr:MULTISPECIES: phosphopantetheine-binding protein [Streptomyces]RST06232.1 acyl carrier protein [Streptomyces sp. WAC07149]GLX17904.1 acyl carrier protein [Streptomyces lavendulae subsp. lavendulae]GLX26248.1 acyl carrier protein [Streptomyces lavendulae subsp. lavendulae]